MVTELPPPPAPLVERLEASFPLPAELAPYEYLWASEGETPPESVPVRQFYRPAGRHVGGGQFRSASGKYALANPINLVLERLGFSFRTRLLEIRNRKMIQVPMTENSNGGETGGLGDGSPGPVPPGDPIPVDGGGKPPGG